MLKDPGTIYSDDEIEDYSESDSEEDEKEKNQIKNKKAKPDTFFNELENPSQETFELNSKRYENSVAQKLKSNPNLTKPYDVNKLIERIRKENLPKEKATLEKEIKTEDVCTVSSKAVERKEKKSQRKQEKLEKELQKDKELLSFEDAEPAGQNTTFLELNLSPPILKGVANMGFHNPTPIQTMTIPYALKGRDICGCAATGTGKTAAFMLPIFQRLLFRPRKALVTRVLILVPTRELGIQVFEMSKELAHYVDVTFSLSVGGLDMTSQMTELQGNPDIVIATPGRLIDHMYNTPDFSLHEIEILVLDEADRMLDEFFSEQITEIVKQCCDTRQTMLFSATMTDNVKDLVAVSLKKPVRVFANSNTDVAENLRQEFVRMRKNTETERSAILAYLLMHHFRDDCMVFVTTRDECHDLRVKFGLLGIKCGELHGKMRQNVRVDQLDKFKNREVKILFTTDVAARGLDIKGIKTVINYQAPQSYEMYVHRVGRTARAGFSGRSITIAYDSGSDYRLLRQIQKHSLTPLYERFIKIENVDLYMEKLASVEKLYKEVIKLERQDRAMNNATEAVEKLKKKIQTINRPPPPKDQRIPGSIPIIKGLNTKGKDENTLEMKKKKLRAIADGTILPDLKTKKQKPTQQMKNPRIQQKQKVIEERVQDTADHGFDDDDDDRPRKKSNFRKDLTAVDPQSVKELRREIQVEERKRELSQRYGQKRGKGQVPNAKGGNHNKFGRKKIKR